MIGISKTEMNEIKYKLKRLPFKVLSAVLFGSFARGSQVKDSDIDILVISDDIPPHRYQRYKEISIIKDIIKID